MKRIFARPALLFCTSLMAISGYAQQETGSSAATKSSTQQSTPTPADDRETIKQMMRLIQQLEGRISDLEAKQAALATQPS